MSERHVLVTVKIRTEGARCRDWLDDGNAEACPFFNHEREVCRLFQRDLQRVEVDDESRFARVPECLALDAAGDG